MALLRKEPQFRFIVFCDDLSFDAQDTSYKSLKAALMAVSKDAPRMFCSTPPQPASSPAA